MLTPHESCPSTRGATCGSAHSVMRHQISRQILFVQGAGEAVHDAWDAKLVRSLERELGRGYSVRYPRMPVEADPHYAVGKAALLSELDKLEDGALLVRHS